MENCITCGTEPTVPVCTCDCQCLDTARASGSREIRLIAPTRDTDTAWTENDPIVPEGVQCLVKDKLFDGSLQYFIGDGESKYSELTMLYAGAPLSRTGAENHSPLAASGKSTLDPSWLPDATSSAKGAVMTSTTGAAGKVPIAPSGASALDPSWLPTATNSALGGVMTSTTGASGKVPIADSSDKLDPSWLPAATSTTLGGVLASTTTAANNVVKADGNGSLAGWKDAIIDAIIADDGSGGLSTGEDGNLEVDFDAMYTHNREKFEALLKSLKMQIPLEATLNLYVNGTTGTDTTAVEGQGKSAALPFKTIQYAVNYATQTFAFGAYNGNIYVAPGTYEESVRLPQYTRTSGSILLRALDETNPPTIATPSNSNFATPVAVSGGTWSLRRLNISAVWSDPGTDDFTHSPCVLSVTGGSTYCILRGCTLSGEFTGPAGTGWNNPRILLATEGAIVDLSTMPNYRNSFVCAKGNSNDMSVFNVTSNSQLRFRSANDANDANSQVDRYEIPCSGSTHVFALAANNSRIASFSGGKYYPYFSGTMTGKKYAIANYSSIDAPYGGFPGDTDGTPGAADSYKDMDTFARYSERSTPNP